MLVKGASKILGAHNWNSYHSTVNLMVQSGHNFEHITTAHHIFAPERRLFDGFILNTWIVGETDHHHYHQYLKTSIQMLIINSMLTFSAFILAICAGNSPVTGELPAQKPATWSFDVFFYIRMNKWLSKQLRGGWFKTP